MGYPHALWDIGAGIALHGIVCVNWDTSVPRRLRPVSSVFT